MQTVRRTYAEFFNDNCPRMAAAISYYAIFALPALLVIGLAVAGLVVDPQQIRLEVNEQVGSVLGPDGADLINVMIDKTISPRYSTLGFILGGGILLFSATGIMLELQRSLNDVWRVQPDPERGALRPMLIDRLLSFGMVLSFALVLLGLLVVSTVLAWLAARFDARFPGDTSWATAYATEVGTNFVIVSLLLAASYKWLPSVQLRWRDVWIGTTVATLLFVGGKFLLAWYLGNVARVSAYGAAGSLVLILLWVYYSAMIFLLGAEFIKARLQTYGREITPAAGAVRIVESFCRSGEASKT